MSVNQRWVLPEGIEELLPTQAWALEHLRRQLLDLYSSWGYELIIPPMVEYLDSLITGLGEDLAQQTFKTQDQLTGRSLGIRPDITPQAARIDAHRIGANGPTRLCYAGSVLRTHASALGGTRSPMQVGIELFGHAGVESDIEVLSLLISTLELSGIEQVHIDLGHVAVFRGLSKAADLDPDLESRIFDCLQRKSTPDLIELLGSCHLSENHQHWFLILLELSGDIQVLQRAESEYRTAPAEVMSAIGQVKLIAQLINEQAPQVDLCIDLAELRGYAYHTGSVFAAYVAGHGQAIAQGGRYDHIGEVFGRARPATGFSADMKTLLNLGHTETVQKPAVLAPAEQQPGLIEAIVHFRQQGYRVIRALPGTPKLEGVTQQLVQHQGEWQIS